MVSVPNPKSQIQHRLTRENVKKVADLLPKMLHLLIKVLTTKVTQPSKTLIGGIANANPCSFIPLTQQQINQPGAGFCFQFFPLSKNCILCYDEIMRSAKM